MTEHPILFSGEMVRAILGGSKTQTRRVVRLPDHAKRPDADWIKSIHQDGGGNWVAWSSNEAQLVEFTKKAYPNGEGFKCPYGKVGDRLWVRETFVVESNFNLDSEENYPPPFRDGRPIKHVDNDEYGEYWEQCHYRATDPKPELVNTNTDEECVWKPSIFMPRWASRINLEIVSVCVERVQDISEEDAKAEGINFFGSSDSILEGSYLYSANPLPVKNESDSKFGWSHTAKDAYRVLWDSINAKRGYGWDKNPFVWCIEFRKVA